MFTLIVLTITVLTALLPLIVPQLTWILRLRTYPSPVWLPSIAAVLFYFSFYLPDIHISPETTTFQQHLVGGGMYSGVLYLYAKRLFHWNFSGIGDIVMLFAWVSSLGVINKLLEFALAKSNLMILDMSDAYWDLLANTLGAYLVYLILMVVGFIFSRLNTLSTR
jgi:hypothetical protein